jgi:hypothetical protein
MMLRKPAFGPALSYPKHDFSSLRLATVHRAG